MAATTDILRLRAIGPDPVLANYTDAELNDLLESVGGDVRRAAGLLWEERVAETSGFVDIKEGSSSRNMRQEFENAVQMAVTYLGGEFRSNPRRTAKVHQITRD